MKKIIWTKADANRAEKMGWNLFAYETRNSWAYVIVRHGNRFKSDDEAIEWVMTMMIAYYYGGGELAGQRLNVSTCRDALFLCAKG